MKLLFVLLTSLLLSLIISCKKQEDYSEGKLYQGIMEVYAEEAYINKPHEYTYDTYNHSVVFYREEDSINIRLIDRIHTIYYPSSDYGTTVYDVQMHSKYLPSSLLQFRLFDQDSMFIYAIRFGHFDGANETPNYVEENYFFKGKTK